MTSPAADEILRNLDSRNAVSSDPVTDEIRIRIAEGDGEPVDQYGRNQSECLRSAVLAQGHADDAFAAVAELRNGSIILGLRGGNHQLEQLEEIAPLFERTAERDLAFVDAFELAGGEEAAPAGGRGTVELDRAELAKHPTFDHEYRTAFNLVASRVLASTAHALGRARGIGETVGRVEAISAGLAVVAERADDFDGFQAPVDGSLRQLRSLQRMFARTALLLWSAIAELRANTDIAGVAVEVLALRVEELLAEAEPLDEPPAAGHVEAMKTELVSEMLELASRRVRRTLESESEVS